MLPGYSSFNKPVQSALGFPLLDRTPRPKVTSDGKSGREPEAGAGAEAMEVCLLLTAHSAWFLTAPPAQGCHTGS